MTDGDSIIIHTSITDSNHTGLVIKGTGRTDVRDTHLSGRSSAQQRCQAADPEDPDPVLVHENPYMAATLAELLEGVNLIKKYYSTTTTKHEVSFTLFTGFQV